MKIIGIIPSRYHSTRFPGKALADLNGRPLLLYACEAARQSGILDELLVATDSEEIRSACESRGFSAVMTASSHRTPTSRVREAAEKFPADLYVMIGGDEPLLSPADIRLVVERAVKEQTTGNQAMENQVMRNRAMREPACQVLRAAIPPVVNASGIITEPSEVLDPSNIKIVCSESGEGLYASRSPIPYPKGTLDCKYRKFVSVGVYTKEALDFFVSTPPSRLELTEECDLLRFLEHRRRVLFVDIPGRTLSVDTPADLARVRELNNKGVLK